MTSKETVHQSESNLSPELQKLVRTDAFKTWFGDWEDNPDTASKIVDENGEPQLVFFGGPAGIERLSGDKRSRTGSDEIGFYFTDSARSAKFYAETLRDPETDGRVPSSVYSAFLNVRCPYYKQPNDGVRTERVTEMPDDYDGYVKSAETVIFSPDQVLFVDEEPIYAGPSKAPIDSLVEIAE